MNGNHCGKKEIIGWFDYSGHEVYFFFVEEFDKLVAGR